MAFLGDFGRIFLGGKTSQEVGGNVGQAVGSIFGPEYAIIGENLGSDLGKDIGEIGSSDMDVSAPPAGIDSPASAFEVSQTGMLQPTNGFNGGFGNPLMTGNVLSLFGGLTGAAGKAISKPGVGGLVGGLGAGAAVDFFIDQFGQQKKLVITRKLQRDIKKIFMMTGGDVRTTSDIYRSATGRFIPEDKILKILFKTFKNQGPYVTKAAVRKTRSTIRKMETLCDLKDRLCPPKRRAPARRRTMSTSITQVK